MKRLLCLSIVFVMLLTGCSSGNTDTTSSQASSSSNYTQSVKEPIITEYGDYPMLITPTSSIRLCDVIVLEAGDPQGLNDMPSLVLEYFIIYKGDKTIDVPDYMIKSTEVIQNYNPENIIPLSYAASVISNYHKDPDKYKDTLSSNEHGYYRDAYRLDNLTDPITIRFNDPDAETPEFVGTYTLDIAKLSDQTVDNSSSTNSQPLEKEDNTSSSSLTLGQLNALETAGSYLDVMPFSYSGLIKQLEYEGYTHEEAVYAADHCGTDWNEQAVKSAKLYLDTMTFSRQGLIEQLEYEGFTHDQAVYGAEQNGY